MRLFKREAYLSKIRGFYDDEETIKVISGVRRCGKSCLMRMIQEEIEGRGVGKDHILYLDLDKRGLRSIKSKSQLEALIAPLAELSGTKYVFIDEIQNVKGFEEVVNGFRTEGGFSIFITGSNSYLLSGELATKLTGRYIEFEVQTLTFPEYCDMKRFLGKRVSPDLTKELDAYILEGGFPKALYYDSMQDKRTYVTSVVNEIIEKDVRRRVRISNLSLFTQIQSYIINNFGATTSLTNILKELEKQGVHLKRETLSRYLGILEDAKIIRKCTRFDMKSRKSLQGQQKYYLADLSFFFALNTDNKINYGPVLENIVYSYARSKDYSVSVGRIGKLECDFIVRDQSMGYAYVQVAMTIASSKDTEDREYAPLERQRDNYPKFVLTRNDSTQRRSGVYHENITDFMMRGKGFTDGLYSEPYEWEHGDDIDMYRTIECPSCKFAQRIDLADYVIDATTGEDNDITMGPDVVYDFDAEDIVCLECGAKLRAYGYIREYPIGAFDSEYIKVVLAR
ncbi:ATP-binding protein [Adlercreutzia sp. ZJ242]|uniref:ATP-binding protein n=1 Tax=Adlercreutzia sp. ZJ242 TaxID=2709409 RepID=UPI0013EBCA20|nr:ATP-binding protein [Adlercreutzia sp. ZJ242]